MFGLTWLSEYVMSGVSKVPIVVSAFMITVTSSACGGLALSIGLFFYFFKVNTFLFYLITYVLMFSLYLGEGKRSTAHFYSPRGKHL